MGLGPTAKHRVGRTEGTERRTNTFGLIVGFVDS